MRVIGVTGSVGKTSTKELVWQVVSRRFHAIRNVGSLNSETGLPMTLLAIDDAPEIAVLEMAMYVPGDIGLLCRIARPQIGIVTNVGISHLARAGSLQAIIDAKAELPESLPAGGLAILNFDDPNVRGMAARSPAPVLTFGLQAGADVRADDVVSHGLAGQSFVLHYGGRSAPVKSQVIGRHRLPNLLAAAAAGIGVGMDLDEIADTLTGAGAEVRLRIIAGPGGSTIIDDTYNASPASVIGALNLLAEMPGRRLALLGDMRELGELEVSAHREVGECAARCCDALYVVGDLGRVIGEAAQAAGLQSVRALDDKDQAVRELQPALTEGDYLLVKASRVLELDVAVAQLAGAREAA
jgi:UDP-N-acetylmuramoyl-tripeptide--D-alanyl-D-alanine ligase